MKAGTPAEDKTIYGLVDRKLRKLAVDARRFASTAKHEADHEPRAKL